mmetsp:Transcript_98848/g.304650  ORF Transcript_98848/g.304650 Transcript_98848/m.304650 type:complete len:738 (-) Transcript_98848:235-2448(-)
MWASTGRGGGLRFEARGKLRDGSLRGDPRWLLHAGVQLVLQLLGDVPHRQGEGLQLLLGLRLQGWVSQRPLHHLQAVVEVLQLRGERLGVALLEGLGLGRPALPQAALQGERKVPAGGLELRPEAPVARLGGTLGCQILEEVVELASKGPARAVVIEAVLVTDDRHGQHAQHALPEACRLVKVHEPPHALDAALDVAQLHANAQEALPHLPHLAAAARGLDHAVPRLVEPPQGGVRRCEVCPGLPVLVVHAYAAREGGGGVLKALEPHLCDAHCEPHVGVQRIDVQRQAEGVHGLRQVLLVEVVAAKGTLRTCKAALGQLPCLLVMPGLLLQVAEAAPEPGRGALLQELVDHVERLDIPLCNHKAVNGLGPHAQLLELLVRGAHHAHPHHARAHLPLQVEAGGVARAVDRDEAVGGGGPPVVELVHERLQLEGRALARLVAVVLRAAAVVQAAAEAEPVGGEERTVLLSGVRGLLFRPEDALREGVDLLEEHFVVGVARDPEVAALGEEDELLHNAERRLKQSLLVAVNGIREFGHFEHVRQVVHARELQVLRHVADGRAVFLRVAAHGTARRGSGGGVGLTGRLDPELRKLLRLVLALYAKDPRDLEGEAGLAAGRPLHVLEGLHAPVPAQAHGHLHEQCSPQGRRRQRQRRAEGDGVAVRLLRGCHGRQCHGLARRVYGGYDGGRSRCRSKPAPSVPPCVEHRLGRGLQCGQGLSGQQARQQRAALGRPGEVAER